MKYVVGTINREGDFKVQLVPLNDQYEYDGEPIEDFEFTAAGVLSCGHNGRLILTVDDVEQKKGGKQS